MPATDFAGRGGRASIDDPPNSQTSHNVLENSRPGLQAGWFGPLDTFCELVGVGTDVRKALEKSLASDAAFLNLTQRQQFLSAETGIRHLAKLAEDERNGVDISGRKKGR